MNKIYLLDMDMQLIDCIYSDVFNTFNRIKYINIENLYEVLKYNKVILESSLEFDVLKSRILNRLPLDKRLENLIVAPNSESEVYCYNSLYGRWKLHYQHLLNYTSLLDILTAIDAVKLIDRKILNNVKITNTLSRVIIKAAKHNTVGDVFTSRLANIEASSKLRKLLPKYNITLNSFSDIIITNNLERNDVLNSYTNLIKPTINTNYTNFNAEENQLKFELIQLDDLRTIRRQCENL